MDNWGFKGGQSAADIFFNFKNWFSYYLIKFHLMK
jgi:hypothetical protein